MQEISIFTKKFITILTLFWGIFLIPSLLMVLLTLTGNSLLPETSGFSYQVLRIIILSYPVVLGISIAGSWISYNRKKYVLAKVFALLPLLSVFLELIVADVLFLL